MILLVFTGGNEGNGHQAAIFPFGMTQRWYRILTFALTTGLAGCTVIFETSSGQPGDLGGLSSAARSRDDGDADRNHLADEVAADEPAGRSRSSVAADRVADTDEPADVRLTNHLEKLGRLPAEASHRRTVKPRDGAPSDDEPLDADQVDSLIVAARRERLLDAAAETELRRSLADVAPEFRGLMAKTVLAMKRRETERRASPAPASPTSTDNNTDDPPNPNSLPAARSSLAPKINTRFDAHDAWRSGRKTVPPSVSTPGDPRGDERSGQAPTGDPGTQPVLHSTTVAGEQATVHFNGTPKSSRDPAPTTRRDEWSSLLAASIRSLEQDLSQSPPKPSDVDAVRKQAQLRMLYLLAGRRDDALEPLKNAAPELRDFWHAWLYGTATYLDATGAPNDAQRASLAAHRLREAIVHLGKQGNLEIHNLAFCRRVTSFGVYETLAEKPDTVQLAAHKPPAARDGAPVASSTTGATTANRDERYVFRPNQEVLLYAEVRNFVSVPTDRGYHTVLRPSYQVFDAQGRRVGPIVELDESHDYCRQQRHDFFVRYHVYLPSRIDPGDYKLKLTIEDVQARKVAENGIEFTIVAK